jgi:hypothetical protein
MSPVDQTIFLPPQFDPNSTVRGNCVQASIASVLELPLSAVPHCAHMTHSIFKTFLKQHGLGWIKTPVDDVHEGYHLIAGIGPRTQFGVDGVTAFPVNHCVVGFNGEIVHDPHPSRAGLQCQEEFWWFITLNPAKAEGRQ